MYSTSLYCMWKTQKSNHVTLKSYVQGSSKNWCMKSSIYLYKWLFGSFSEPGMPKQLHVITVITDLCAEKRLTNKGHGPRGKLDFCFGLVFSFFTQKTQYHKTRVTKPFPSLHLLQQEKRNVWWKVKKWKPAASSRRNAHGPHRFP